MKIIIAGGREFNDYESLCTEVRRILTGKLDISIISGTARGADSLGAKYATACGYNLIQMPADWNKYGKAAGYRRNEEMAQIADMAIVFWDGYSKGSGHMIDIMHNLKKPVEIIRY